ncbi:MAG: hypothetical protein U0531_19220 [Dehalococcoidia bacterium]
MIACHGDYAVIDAGLKSLTNEFGAPAGKDLPFVVSRLSEEHGTAELNGADLRPGMKVEIVPSHGDTTLNLYSAYHVVRGDEVVAVWPIEAARAFTAVTSARRAPGGCTTDRGSTGSDSAPAPPGSGAAARTGEADHVARLHRRGVAFGAAEDRSAQVAGDGKRRPGRRRFVHASPRSALLARPPATCSGAGRRNCGAGARQAAGASYCSPSRRKG